MKRAILITTAAAALVAPAGAPAKVVELGSGAERARASCPEDCQAITRLTGYQVRAGEDVRQPMVVPRKGKVVAFSIRLGKPDEEQISFFEDELSLGAPQAGLAILRQSSERGKRRNHRLRRQSQMFSLERYFGGHPTFVLDEPLTVAKGSIVALTVPTWAPALAVGLDRANSWRSSRKRRVEPEGPCKNVTQRAQHTKLKEIKAYECDYRTARLLYTVTYVPNPRPTGGRKRDERRDGSRGARRG